MLFELMKNLRDYWAMCPCLYLPFKKLFAINNLIPCFRIIK